MTETPRFKLSLMSASQSQKHITFNEAMLKLDLLVGTIPVINRTRTSPPSGASDGAVYILAGSGSGDWLGFSANDLALMIDGGWRRVLPSNGMVACLNDEGGLLVWFNGSTWHVALGGASTITETAAFTLADEHFGATVRLNVSADANVTLPAEATVGTSFQLLQVGNGRAVFVPATGATLVNDAGHSKSFAKWSVCGAFVESNADDESAQWVLFGSTTI